VAVTDGLVWDDGVLAVLERDSLEVRAQAFALVIGKML
jgi:hypothetical protein